MDFSIFTEAQTWVTLFTLLFLEIALGIDNIVFITITADRLPAHQQHLGRKLGLLGALIMRIIFLCFASFLVHMTDALFTIDLGFFRHGFSLRDLVLLLGGAYLVYKGIAEQREMLKLTELREQAHAAAVATVPAATGAAAATTAAAAPGKTSSRLISMPQAVGSIMLMDLVFSIDSVITAVGIAEHLIVMIIAVIAAVLLMMVFIDQISTFINRHAEMKLLALAFITMIGCLLVIESLELTTHIMVLGMELEKFVVYCALVFGLILECVQMRYNTNVRAFEEEQRARLGQATDKSAQQATDKSAQEPAQQATQQPLQ